MSPIAYLFERFPSAGQTFCHREVQELIRQGADARIFSIRSAEGDVPPDPLSPMSRVVYLPEESALTAEVTRLIKEKKLPGAAIRALEKWGRQTDFLRLMQAAFLGARLREEGIERVHAHFAGMAARTAYWIREFFGIAYSLTAHANDIFAPRDFAVSLPMILKDAAAVVTVSDFSVDYLRTRFPAEAEKIHRVYNGVELQRFWKAENPADPPSLISVGRLIPKKGFRTLIAACARLRRSGRRFHCQIIGEGPLFGELATQVANAQLGNEVQLVGPLGQAAIADRLATATAFVLPCTRDADGGMDNLPTVIMEAMASGLPVISTPLAGIPEMVEPGVTGLLVPPDDPVALAAAIDGLLRQPAEARLLGARGRERAAEKFSIETNVRLLAAILEGR